jgi:hypothetical protein
MLVAKVGRTTRYSEGIVTGISALVRIAYTKGRTATFRNQFLVTSNEKFFDEGDSGAVIVDLASHKVVGLGFAAINGSCWASPMSAIVAKLLNRLS